MSLITTTTPPTTRPCCYATTLAKSSCNKRNIIIIIKQHSSATTTFPLAFSHYSSIFNFHSRNVVSNQRRRFTLFASCSLVLPLLPFPLEQVLVPSESKTLHLYEARYLELLEESISRKKKLFVHFVLDPIVVGYAIAEASFAARYGCLVSVDKVERLDVGALVSIRGIGRVTITQFMQADPYLMGLVLPLMDNIPLNLSSLDGQVSELKRALYSLNSLEMKLKATKDEILQTQTANSLLWSENKSSLDCDDAFIPSVAERVSFSALQPISGSSQSELLELQKEKLKAMDIKETPERLDFSLNFVKKNISMLAAKLAIQSLELQ